MSRLFPVADVFVRNVGESWASNQVFGNHHYELLLKSGDKSAFFFKPLIEPPSDGIACLDFRYKKISSGLRLFLYDPALSCVSATDFAH